MPDRLPPGRCRDLDEAELDWLNAYHARVREEVSPLIEEESVKVWLEKMTAPLSR
jgi:Xaa-Pro aminopeptidase